jgi:hypothetical protein
MMLAWRERRNIPQEKEQGKGGVQRGAEALLSINHGPTPRIQEPQAEKG